MVTCAAALWQRLKDAKVRGTEWTVGGQKWVREQRVDCRAAVQMGRVQRDQAWLIRASLWDLLLTSLF